jgi:3-dehydroquinate dehydratase/shikimate dehydrogenase
MIAEHRHLVEQGAELVELRLDYIDGPVSLKRLLADRPGPVIVTCRRQADGGRWTGSEADRQLLLRQAIVDGVEYIDLEEDIAGSVPRFGKTQRIVSLHDFRRTPENLETLHARMCGLNPDIVKLATMANHPSDNFRMLKLIQASKIPTAGMCMGDIGAPSRVLCGKFGAPFTYATFSLERVLAPGQLSFQQMTEVYHYNQLNAESAVYGVMADPVGHSLSPQLHNAALQQAGINAVYVPFRVPAPDLDGFLANVPEYGIRGLSVTIPHKESVLKHLTKIDGAVKAVGAANTLIFDGAEILGFNTDYRAAMDSLEQAVGMEADGPNKLKGRTALILGAGGAAKAIAAGLKRREANVVVTGRTLARAQQLAERTDCKAIEWHARHNVAADILVNCTPVGMHPNVDESPFDKRELKPSMVVFDTVYNPENTLLVKDARSRSCTIVTGVEMFVRQAALQFQLFTGKETSPELLREVLKRAIGPARY